jgi:drug/metabolite transporter (DMT)-like permease
MKNSKSKLPHLESNETKATIMALSTIILWSTVATAFKLSLNHLKPIQLLAWACIFSMIALGLLLYYTGQLNIAGFSNKNGSFKFLILSLLNPLLYYIILFKAYDFLPAQEAQALNYTWAFTLALLSVPLLKQKLSKWDLIGGIVSYCGVWTIITRGKILSLEFASPAGVSLALGSTIIWSLYWIIARKDSSPQIPALFKNFLFATPLIWVICALTEGLTIPSLKGLAGAAYVGFFEMGFAFALWLKAMKLTNNSSRISNLIFLSPFLSLIFISVFLKEKIFFSTIPGLILIVIGLTLQRALKRN